jgi:hypothetical protein
MIIIIWDVFIDHDDILIIINYIYVIDLHFSFWLFWFND